MNVPGIIAARRAAGGGTDPLFANVALLLHGEGANLGTTFIDSSANGFTPASVAGCTTSTVNKQFGASSILCTGASNSVIRYADSAAFTIGSGQFLIELLVYFNGLGTQQFLCGQSNSAAANTSISVAMQKTAANAIRAFCCTGGATLAGDITSASTLSAATWYYIAYGRDAGNVFRLFIDAVAEGTSSPGPLAVNDSANDFGVCGLGESTIGKLGGNMEEFRFTVGAYRDVATIGVPAAPFPDA